MSNDKYYTVEEFAKILKIGPQSIRRAIRAGRIHGFRVSIGKKAAYRIAETEFDRIALMSYQETINNIKPLITKDEYDSPNISHTPIT